VLDDILSSSVFTLIVAVAGAIATSAMGPSAHDNLDLAIPVAAASASAAASDASLPMVVRLPDVIVTGHRPAPVEHEVAAALH